MEAPNRIAYRRDALVAIPGHRQHEDRQAEPEDVDEPVGEDQGCEALQPDVQRPENQADEERGQDPRHHSLHPADIEHALRRVGLTINEQVDYRSEWGERSQEQEGTAGRRLLYAARLLRQPDRYMEQFGRANYDIMLGDCLWHIYRMMGKLTGYAVTFTKPD